jgi:hypothetical protein
MNCKNCTVTEDCEYCSKHKKLIPPQRQFISPNEFMLVEYAMMGLGIVLGLFYGYMMWE